MCIKGGFILQPRSIDESEVAAFPPHVREIWLYFLRKANHRDVILSGKTLRRGQLITSYSEIIEDLSWYVGYRKESYKKHHCGTAMKLLTKAQMIETAKTTRGMIVTICKYDYYQSIENYETNSGANNEQTMNKQWSSTINKNDKNVRSNNIYTSEVQKANYKKALLSELNSDEYDLNNEYVEIAKAFQKLFISNLSEAGASTRQVEKAGGAWVDPIRLAIEKDGYSVADFREVFEFLRRDAFWKSNILSTQKLRQQMAKLKIQIKNENIRNSNRTGKQNQRQSFSDEELAEQIRQGAARAIADASSEAGY